MWIFTPTGFLSVVRNKHARTPALTVRSRQRKDLENFWERLPRSVKGSTPIHASTNADYQFRLFCSRRAFEHAMRRLCREITYTNFKSACSKERSGVLHRIWSALLDKWPEGSIYGSRGRGFDLGADGRRSRWLQGFDLGAGEAIPASWEHGADTSMLERITDPDAPCYCDALLGDGVCGVCLAKTEEEGT